MNSITVSTGILDTPHKAAKVAGFMFLFSLIVPSLNWALVLSKLIVAGDAVATANNIMANELIFRIGLGIELFMSVGLVVLGVALYLLLKPVNKNLALLALLWKLMEAVLAASIVLVTYIALQVSNGAASQTAFTPEQLHAIVGFLLNEHTATYSIPMLFLGLGMILFCYLLFKSKYIPKMLAGFGIFSFALIFIHALLYILAPEQAAMSISQIIFYTPSGLFEIAIGIWLLVKGVRIRRLEGDGR